MRSRRHFAKFVGFVFLCSASLAHDSVQASEPWRIGMSAAFSGPAQRLGNGMRTGIQSYFDLVNERGGVHGRPLELIAIDDGYSPPNAAKNMRKLITEHQVMCVIGNVGTPTAAVSVPIANELKIPMFGPFTGAGLLRKQPPDRYVINFRASYAEECSRMVQGIVDELKIPASRIGFFTQNDAYGDAGWNGAIQALKSQGYEDAEFLPHGRYTRNTDNVEAALSDLMDPLNCVEAIIMVGAYRPCAKFIKLARTNGFNPLFINLSFVGTTALINELGEFGEGVVITQVVPPPTGNSDAAMSFRKVVSREHQNFVSFEGYLVAKAFVEILQAAGPAANTETFIDTLERGVPIELGLPTTSRLSPKEHQMSHQVWPTMIHGRGVIELRSWRDTTRRFENTDQRATP